MVLKHLRLVAFLLAVAVCALVAVPLYAAYFGAAKTLPATFEIVAPTLGDANGDDVVDVLDLTKVARIILWLEAETPGANANLDGVVDVLDLTRIVRLILRLD